MAKPMTKLENDQAEAEVVTTKQQVEKGETSDMINFLEKTAMIDTKVMAFIKKDANLLKSFYQTEHDKWAASQSCMMAEVSDKHETELSEIAKTWIKENKAALGEYAKSNIGNKQSQTLKANFLLNTGDRLEVVITALRKKPLTPEEVQMPVDMIDSLSDDMLTGAGVKKSVDMVTLRRRSVSLIGKDDQFKDDMFRYGAKVLIRKSTKKELED